MHRNKTYLQISINELISTFQFGQRSAVANFAVSLCSVNKKMGFLFFFFILQKVTANFATADLPHFKIIILAIYMVKTQICLSLHTKGKKSTQKRVHRVKTVKKVLK